MSSPASLRPLVACSTLAVLVALAGCGNRGELYLEPSVDAAAEAEIRRLGTDPLEDDADERDLPAPDPAVAPSSGSGVAPIVAPTAASGSAPDGVPEDAENDDRGKKGVAGERVDGGEAAGT